MRRAAINLAALFVLSILLSFGNTGMLADLPATTREVPFSGREFYSRGNATFTKWTGMLARLDAHHAPLKPFIDNKRSLEVMNPVNMVQRVNSLVNKYAYLSDLIISGVSDYWQSPAEFFARGGDCEDYSIAKYAWLRSLGISEDRLRVAVVHDRIRNMSHSVLILYVGDNAMVLDSLVADIRDSRTTSRYRMLYSINRQGWWLPLKAKPGSSIAMKEMGLAVALRGDTIQFTRKCLAGANLPECINAVEPAAR